MCDARPSGLAFWSSLCYNDYVEHLSYFYPATCRRIVCYDGQAIIQRK